MEKKELNENDQKLLGFCYDKRRHLSEIARNIGIDVKNVSVRISSLKERGLISIEYIGNKKYIRTKRGKKTKEYFLKVLKQLNELGGEMKEDDFLSLIPFAPDNIDSDRYNAPLKLLWLYPKLAEQYIKITPEGEKFLKDNSKV